MDIIMKSRKTFLCESIGQNASKIRHLKHDIVTSHTDLQSMLKRKLYENVDVMIAKSHELVFSSAKNVSEEKLSRLVGTSARARVI